VPDFSVQTRESHGRHWRPRHPLRPRVSRRRRRITAIISLVLWLIIGAYVYLTNESRVRAMAQSQLSRLCGGRVEIGHARLSLFEGLRLDHVQLTVPAGDGPQSMLLEAGSVVAQCHLSDLLTGRFSAAQIIVTDPHIRLAQDMDSGHWNYQLLTKSNVKGGPAALPTELPEILLRHLRVDEIEVRGGKAQVTGWMTMDGRLGTSNQPGEFEFSLQSHGREALGPTMDGILNPLSGRAKASMRNFVFGPDIRAMLPAQVQQWCVEHELTGRMSLSLDYALGPSAPSGDFKVAADLEGVDLAINPQVGRNAVTVHDAAGTVIFTRDGIELQNVTAWQGANGVMVAGRIHGYSPEAPLDLAVNSIGALNLPEHPPELASLPPQVIEVYKKFLPLGRAAVVVQLTRVKPGGSISARGEANLLDAGFTFADVPYPIRNATGRITFGPDDRLGFYTIRLVNVRGHGEKGGVNENAELSVDGWIGSFDHAGGGIIQVRGRDIRMDAAAKAALPAPAEAALDMLDARHQGLGRDFLASFNALSIRPQAGKVEGIPWETDIDLNLSHAEAAYAGFPYPLHNAAATLQIRPAFVMVSGLTAQNGPARFSIEGRIDLAQNSFSPDLRVTARDLPIDSDLLSALPAEARDRLTQIGAKGKLDVDGRVVGAALAYDLNMNLRDGELSPGGITQATDLTGLIHATPQIIEARKITGRRQDATLLAAGAIEGSGPNRTLRLDAKAENLLLDQRLYDTLPVDAHAPWDQLHPAGTADISIVYDNRNTESSLKLALTPRRLDVAPQLAAGAQPMALKDVEGRINWVPGREAGWDVSGRHGAGRLAISGAWGVDDPSKWNLRLGGSDLKVDDELLQSLPAGLADVMRLLHFSGTIGFNIPRFVYRQGENPNNPDADFTASLQCRGSNLDLGVPASDIDGTLSLSGTIRAGRLRELAADVNCQSLKIAGRSASDLQMHLAKPADQDAILVSGLKGALCGGNVAGDAAVTMPPAGVGRYAVRLAINAADVRQFAGVDDAGLNGRLSASLQLSGSVGDANSRQGRGDVSVAGEMYQIPLLLGLFQVTNLALPINAPFERASAGYSIQGQRVTLEKITLGGKQTVMEGFGHLDFDTLQVDLTFNTDNPQWLSVPIVGVVVNKAQSELLRIHVKGSMTKPKISASSLDTFRTTVDEVLKGEK